MGAFDLLMREQLDIQQALIDWLTKKGNARLNKTTGRALFKFFKNLCQQKLPPTVYPNNTKQKGRKALFNWFRTVYLETYGTEHMKAEANASTADLLSYAEGDGKAHRPRGGYGSWQIDEHVVDLRAKYELEGLQETHEFELQRFFIVLVRHVESGAKLACRVVFAPQVSKEDVCIALWDAIAGTPPPIEVVPGLVCMEGAGYPANLIPELRYAIPSILFLDNALAHIADVTRHVAEKVMGADFELGKPRSPHGRPHVESDFKTIEEWIHQLIGTTGSSPTDPLREKGNVPLSKLIPAAAIRQYIEVTAMNSNATPHNAAGYGTPLNKLRSQLKSGDLRPLHLPDQRRKDFYFSEGVPRTVKADGRAPYINWNGNRYRSRELSAAYHLKNKRLVVRPGLRNIQTVMLFREDGTEFGLARAEGKWGMIPHDVRIRQLHTRMKNEKDYRESADELPNRSMTRWLIAKAPLDKRYAQSLAYLMEYSIAQDFCAAAKAANDFNAGYSVAAAVRDVETTVIRDPESRTGTEEGQRGLRAEDLAPRLQQDRPRRRSVRL